MVINYHSVSLINLTIWCTGIIRVNADRLQVIGNNFSSFTLGSLFIKGSFCYFDQNFLSSSLNVQGSSNIIKQNIFDELTLQSANNNTIVSNSFQTLRLFASYYNAISENSIQAKTSNFGVELNNSSSNSFSGSYINGLALYNSNDNSFVKNNITSPMTARAHDFNIDIREIDPASPSAYAIALENSNSSVFYHNYIENVIINDQILHNNLFYGNAFVGPALSDDIVRVGYLKVKNNYWDNGSIGNYWYDYSEKYPNASEISNSGIGNTPYIVSPSGSEFDPIAYIDHFPLKTPFSDEAANKVSEPFSIVPVAVASIVSVAVVVVAGLLVYHKKYKTKTPLSLNFYSKNLLSKVKI